VDTSPINRKLLLQKDRAERQSNAIQSNKSSKTTSQPATRKRKILPGSDAEYDPAESGTANRVYLQREKVCASRVVMSMAAEYSNNSLFL
jgi:hypothetical protein